MSGEKGPTIWDNKTKSYAFVANEATISTSAAGTYDATTQAIVAALKTKLDVALAAAKAAGLIAQDP